MVAMEISPTTQLIRDHVDSDGLVTVYLPDGTPLRRRPIDVRQGIAAGTFTMEAPKASAPSPTPEPAPSAPAPAPVATSEPEDSGNGDGDDAGDATGFNSLG